MFCVLSPRKHRLTPFALLLLVSGWCMHSAHAFEAAAEERLQAIRQAMVDAAMNADTHVSATGWIDSRGVLRESSRFSSNVSMRDLRVRQVERGADQMLHADLQARVEPTAPASCELDQVKTSLLQVMRLELALSPELRLAQRFHAQRVGRLARDRLLAVAAQATHWRVMTDAVFTHAYDRLLYGHGEEFVHWQLQLTVQPTFSDLSDAEAPVTLQWQVHAPGQATPWFFVRQNVEPARATAQGVASTIDQDMIRSLEQGVTSLVQQLDQRLACDPQSMVVRQSEGNRWTIDAGRVSGLQVGDQVLLTNARILPALALDAAAVDAAMLAEVKSVSQYQAELQPVAGSRTPASGDWMAWPYTYE